MVCNQKNGILEINFSCTDEKLVGPISYLFVDKISNSTKNSRSKGTPGLRFYRTQDRFARTGTGHLRQQGHPYVEDHVIHHPGKDQYHIPKENLVNEKTNVMRQRDAAANNRKKPCGVCRRLPRSLPYLISQTRHMMSRNLHRSYMR